MFSNLDYHVRDEFQKCFRSLVRPVCYCFLTEEALIMSRLEKYTWADAWDSLANYMSFRRAAMTA